MARTRVSYELRWGHPRKHAPKGDPYRAAKRVARQEKAAAGRKPEAPQRVKK